MIEAGDGSFWKHRQFEIEISVGRRTLDANEGRLPAGKWRKVVFLADGRRGVIAEEDLSRLFRVVRDRAADKVRQG